MMELIEAQKKLQGSSYELLEKRIKKLSSKKDSHVQGFAKAGTILNSVQGLILEVDDFLEKSFQEIVAKVIREENDYYCQLLGVKYKNIDDAVAKPLTSILLNKHKFSEALDQILTSKKDFKTIDRSALENNIEKTLETLVKKLAIGGDVYALLAKEKSKFFTSNSQLIALAIWQLGSNEITNLIMVHLLSLQQKDSLDEENVANSRQTFGAEIGEALHKRSIWRFLRDMLGIKKDKKSEEKIEEKSKLKELFRAYNKSDFEKIDELSRPIWSREVELEVGQKMLDLAHNIEIISEYTKPNDESNFNYFKLNREFLKSIKTKSDKNIVKSASITYKPMVVKPRDWEGLYDGGFLEDNSEEGYFDLELIKASSRKDREALKDKMIPNSVLYAINHIQQTPFKINRKILNVLIDYHNDINDLKKENSVDAAYYRILREILTANLEEQSIDTIYKHFENIKFLKLVDKELTVSDKKRIKKALKKIEKSDSIEQFRVDSTLYYEIAKYKEGFKTIVGIAEDMLDFEKFYFVWRMDFRGRLYPQQTLMHPQAGDMPKSLLLFSNEKPLNEKGKRWFFIHGANCYGEVAKEVFSKRVAWVEEYHDTILACAKDYRKENFWKEAGDPFKFLAWCFEYERYVENPEIFITGIPVAIDGSNNGFQHITALLRDVDGAKKVNVLPSYDEEEKLLMNDFYAEVAIGLKERMREKVEEFKRKKEKFQEKNGCYYKQEISEVFKAEYHLGEVIENLKNIELEELKNNSYFTTLLMRNMQWSLKFSKEELSIIESTLKSEERMARKRVGEENLEEVKYLLLKNIDYASESANRVLKKEELTLKNQKTFGEESKNTLVASSLYQIFLDNDKVNRSLVKGPVMTEAYGSSSEGKAKALLEKIESLGILSHLEESERLLVAREITGLLESALSSVSSSPSLYKKWIKKYAREILKEGDAILWCTPLKLEVKQVEFTFKKVKVSTEKGNRDVTFNIYTDKIDKKAHQKGIAPNYIHSLDASHLMMTVNALAQRGITDIVTVHDSFATHANDVGLLSMTLREAFVALHKKEILPELCQFWEEVFGVEQKKIPYVNKEGFNLEEVLKSEYFFA